LAPDNYSYKKHQKELAQKKKREEKLKSKLEKKNMQAKEQPALADGNGVLPAADSGQALNDDVNIV